MTITSSHDKMVNEIKIRIPAISIGLGPANGAGLLARVMVRFAFVEVCGGDELTSAGA